MYRLLNPNAPLAQGEIIDRCRILSFQRDNPDQDWSSAESLERVIVLTQACDLENNKTSRVQVAVVYESQALVDAGILKPKTIRDQLLRHRVYGWYFLPASAGLSESIVDLRDLHTVSREFLQELAAAGNRVCALETPYREHLAQHFAVTFSRIALPEPYGTE